MDDSLAPLRGRYRSPSYRRVSHGLMMRQAHLGPRDGDCATLPPGGCPPS
jgi:hypothetical protein